MAPDGASGLSGDLRRERAFGLLAAGLCGVLAPLWTVLDWFLEPALAVPFLWLRIAILAVCAPLFFAIRATSSLTAVRWMGIAAVTATGWLIAPMLPLVAPEHYWPYVVGYSLILWGGGVVWTLPVRHAFGMYGLILAGFVAAHLSLGEQQALDVGVAFLYLATAATICIANIAVRRRLELRILDAQTRLAESEKQAALARLTVGLSHELNNPVNVILNNAVPAREHVDAIERILRAYREGQARPPEGGPSARRAREADDVDFILSDLRGALDAVEAGARRVSALHGELRAFVLEGGARRTGDLNETVRQTVDLVRRELPRGVEIREEYGSPSPVVGCFERLAEAVFLLVRNAVESVAGGGQVEVRTRRRPDAVELSVAGDGAVASDGATGQLFEPFAYEPHAGRARRLALAVCYEIARDHGGDLRLDPADGRGSRVVLTLPLARAR